MVENYKVVFSCDDVKIYSIAEDRPIPHRLNGPAVIFKDGSQKWFFLGKEINVTSQEEFEKILQLKAFW